MEVISLDPQWHEKYSDFLASHKETLFYYTIQYRDFLVNLLNCESEYYIAVQDNEIKGVLPILKKYGKWGWVYNSLAYYGSNGGIVANDEAASEALVLQYNRVIAQSEVAAATLINNPLSERDMRKVDHDLVDSRIGQFTPLLSTSSINDTLLSSIHGKTRNMIRKAQKAGVTVEIDNNQIDFLYRVHQENMLAIGGKPKDRKFFESVADYFQVGKQFDIYVAKLDDNIIAALLVFYFNHVVEYYTPVIVERYRTYQPLSLIIFEAMLKSASNGFTWWNWGGTWLTQEGVYRFKKRWGTKDLPYYYYTKINAPSICAASKEELLDEYDNFFVIPFQYLNKSKEVDK